jgi:hypothetical protein
MEKVLRESDDGVLVYVAPTKALVTQVAAEVYARFRKVSTNGKSGSLSLIFASNVASQVVVGQSTPAITTFIMLCTAKFLSPCQKLSPPCCYRLSWRDNGLQGLDGKAYLL